MEKCLHVSKIRPAWDHSILNPEKWLCYLCRTTESVWVWLCLLLSCSLFFQKIKSLKYSLCYFDACHLSGFSISAGHRPKWLAKIIIWPVGTLIRYTVFLLFYNENFCLSYSKFTFWLLMKNLLRILFVFTLFC
jgi:hypothetical protein